MSESNYATTGRLNYCLPPSDGSRPYYNTDADRTTGERERNWIEDSRVVDIENVRGSEEQYTLDSTGFKFGREPSKHARFLDDKEIEAEYYPECVELLKKLTGASRIFIFDHTIRRRRVGAADYSPQERQPATHIHVDQTTTSAIACVHRNLPPSEAPVLLKRRFQIINLWRPISHAAFDWPLTLCDFRSVDMKADLIPIALIYPEREGELYNVRFNETHRWKYMRGMEPDEFVLVKCFDSVQDGSVAILTPHTAFDDPNTPLGSPLRESIEVRALVFYDSD